MENNGFLFEDKIKSPSFHTLHFTILFDSSLFQSVDNSPENNLLLAIDV